MLAGEMELVLVVLLMMLGIRAFAGGAGRTRTLVGVGLVLAISLGLWLRLSAPAPAGSPDDAASAERPLEIRGGGYVSSDACRSCHPAEYASWKQSYHRTMTQVVTPESMVADWDDTELEIRGRTYRLDREGDQYWVDMVDLGFSGKRRFDGRPVANDRATERVRRRAVQSTGSHHQQIYWFPSGNGRELYLFPFTWLIDEERWIPYDASLLWRPDAFQTTEEWNKTCLPCHATAGQPRPVEYSEDLDTHVAELGIACEACHGPAEAHVEHYRNPIARYVQYAGRAKGEKIVNPAKLDARPSAQVCGQCHSHNLLKGREEGRRAATVGRSYRPGDELEATREIHVRPDEADLKTPLQRYGADAITWPDGMVRTAGRDYHGVLASPCYAGGDYDCLTCHSMHAYEDRTDQLKPGMQTNAACLQCHPRFEDRAALEAHTHHAPDSTGSQCYECHMPHSNYALLKSVRTHTLTSPNVKESLEDGRPNACNLCHADQTLAWAAEALARWYGQEPPSSGDGMASERAAAVDWLLEGDAAQRGLIAATLSRPEVQAASGSSWMAPLLARLLDEEEYPALALIGQRSIHGLPGYEDVAVTSEGARARVLARWEHLAVDDHRGARVYQSPSGELDSVGIDAAYSRRNDRRVNVAE